MPTKTVAENVLEAFGAAEGRDRPLQRHLQRIRRADGAGRDGALLAEQADLQEKIDAGDGWELDRRIEIALDALRCPPPDTPVTNLSGGERRRVALCRLLLEKPDLLLLDEPTNHLDAESVAWLEKTLREYAGTVLVVTHDRYFLENVTNWILELERGRGYPFQGNYSSWLEQKQKRLQQEEKEETARMRALAAEQEWIASSPRARQAKSKSRIQRYEEMLREVAGTAGRRGGNRDSARAAPGRHGDRGGASAQGLRQPAADRRPRLQAAARRHRRRDRAERRGQDHAVPHDHRPGDSPMPACCASATR